MAAAQVVTLGLDEVFRLLGERFRLLHNPARDAPLRHQTLQATVEWSYSLLSEVERSVLRQLSVFVGSFRLDAAKFVASSSGTDEWVILDAVNALFSKSLLALDSRRPMRYRLLESVRMYAANELSQRAAAESAVLRHGKAMKEIAEEAEQAFWVMSDGAWAERYGPDMPDLEEAYLQACTRQDAHVGTPIALVLAYRDRFGDAASLSAKHRRAEAAYRLLPVAGRREQAIIWDLMRGCWPHESCGVPRASAGEAAAVLWRELQDEQRLYMGLGELANEKARIGDFGAASAALEEAHQIDTSGWPARVRWSFAVQASPVQLFRRDYQAYRTSLRVELELAEEAGAEIAAAFARLRLADAAAAAGDFAEAVDLGRLAVAEQRTLLRSSNLYLALSNLCGALLMDGDIEGAKQAGLEAWPNALNGMLGPHLDPISVLAARAGMCREASLLCARSDLWYRTNNQPRDPTEVRLVEAARASIERSLEPTEIERLISSGEGLTDVEVDRLVRRVLSRRQ